MDRRTLVSKVTEIILNNLTPPPPQEKIEKIIAEIVLLLEQEIPKEGKAVRHLILTVVGKNHPGIVHSFSEVLAENNVDIVDINQTLVHGNFAMIMILDPSEAKVDFKTLKALLLERGNRENVAVFLQYEDLMRELNRI